MNVFVSIMTVIGLFSILVSTFGMIMFAKEKVEAKAYGTAAFMIVCISGVAVVVAQAITTLL